MTIRPTGRAEIEVVLSLEEAGRMLLEQDFSLFQFGHGAERQLDAALRREEEMQAEAEAGGYAERSRA